MLPSPPHPFPPNPSHHIQPSSTPPPPTTIHENPLINKNGPFSKSQIQKNNFLGLLYRLLSLRLNSLYNFTIVLTLVKRKTFYIL